MALKLNGDSKEKDWSRKNIAFRMDLGMINNLVGYVVKQSPSITRKSLTNLRTYFSILDKTIYENNDKLMERIKFIERVLEARLDLYMENRSLIVDHATTRSEENATIIRNLSRYEKISYDEIRGVNKMVQDRIQYYFVVTYKDKLYNAVERLDSGDFDSYQSISEDIETISKDLINMMRKAKIVSTKSSFSLGEGFETGVVDIVKALRNPARILKTGIQAWNEILVDGYRSKRLYTYMGLPGGYKSWILLKSAYDIKKYNQSIPAKKEGARKTILFITMENDVEETVERLFNMTVTGDDIREFEPDDVVKLLREKGELTLTDDSEIDIVIQYYPDHSISTDDIYTIMDDLEDENREIVAFIIDYVKRIRSATPATDEKIELKNVTNELKTIATEKDIPVITAHQLNRNAASVVDAALQDNKEDVTRQIGRSNVGSALDYSAETAA